MTTRIPTASRNAIIDALTALFNAGSGPGVVQIRSGSQPASANDAASGTLLATITLSDPGFGAGALGIATADITPALEVAASNSGTAGWYRGLDSDAATVIDGSVTATGGGGDLQLNTVSVLSGVSVTITAWTITMPAT